MVSKTKIVVFVIAFITLMSTACGQITFSDSREVVHGSGKVVEETRQVSGFHGVEIATIGDIVVDLGEEEGLRIEAEDNLIEYFETKVRFGILEISTSDRSVMLDPSEPVTFYLTVKEFDTVLVSGSSDIQVPDLETKEFSISITGSGDVTMGTLTVNEFRVDIGGSGEVFVEKLTAKSIDVNIEGSGNVDIDDGMVENQDINIGGSGSYQAGDLESASAEVDIGGSGDVIVWVIESLNVHISGSGDVDYYGQPSTSSTGSGLGRLTSRGEK